MANGLTRVRSQRAMAMGAAVAGLLRSQRAMAMAAAVAGLLCWGVLRDAAGAASDSGNEGANSKVEPSSASQEAPQIDHIALAARLLDDGHPDRALSVLQEADRQAEGFEQGRFFTLRGLAHAWREDHAAARGDFERAVEVGVEDPMVFLKLASSCFALEDYRAALNALERAKAVALPEPGAWLMRAESLWNLGERARALEVLATGERRFPALAEFQRGRLFYLLEMGLHREASRVGEQYLQRPGVNAEDYVAVGEALRAAGQYERAQVLLEQARLRFAQHEQVLLQLAHAYLDARKKVASALVFEHAARLDPKYHAEAAELYKEAGLLHRATWHNAKVLDQISKTKQRLALLVESGDFEAVAAMVPKLSRLQLLDDENVRYAVAYAFFKTGRFSEAEHQLKAIKDAQLFDSAMQLRKAMQRCREAGWQCGI